MAKTSVSQLTSNVKNQDCPIKFDWLNEQTPVVLSLDVARHFGKKHLHVLRDIGKLSLNLPKSFSQSNFGLAKYTDEQGKSRPAYNLTRDGFTLLAMGFTGQKALQWKLKYIEAFNAMERKLLKQSLPTTRPLSTPSDREALRGLVCAWIGVAGLPYSAAWQQVNAHFNIHSITALPKAWIPDAIKFVQSKIDALQQAALPPVETDSLDEIYNQLQILSSQNRQALVAIGKKISKLTGPLYKDAIARLGYKQVGPPCSADSILYCLHSPRYDSLHYLDKAFDSMSHAILTARAVLTLAAK